MNKQQKVGFAIVPKALLCDREIHAISKAIYSYLAGFADKDGRAYPSRSLICSDLSITKDTLSKYLKQLVNNGYVIIEKSKQHGRFCNNVYILTVPKLSDTVLSDTVLSDTVKRSLTLPCINKTNFNKTYSNRGVHPRDKPIKHKHGEFNHVMLSDEELAKLIHDYGGNTVNDYIKRVDEYIEQTGRKYKNHALTIRTWYRRDCEKQQPTKTKTTEADYSDFNAFFEEG